jgi:hypothetical protein
MAVIYVTSIYKIYDNDYTDTLWERVRTLPVSVHLFCDPQDAEKAEALPNVIPIYKPLYTFATYKTLEKTSQLPSIRNPEKDTKLYMILMNMKPECLELARLKTYANHYVWIDAGIVKILSSPSVLETACKRLTAPLRDDALFIPGCWFQQPVDHDRIHWRFCGGFCIVPHDYVTQFFIRSLRMCAQIAEEEDKAVWEVNVWASIEHLLPIQWAPGDHTDAIFRGIDNYVENSSFSTTLRLIT